MERAVQVTAWFHKRMNLLMSRLSNEEEGDAVIVYDEREVSNRGQIRNYYALLFSLSKTPGE